MVSWHKRNSTITQGRILQSLLRIDLPPPSPPSAACCKAIADADLPCLCAYKNSPLLGIDPAFCHAAASDVQSHHLCRRARGGDGWINTCFPAFKVCGNTPAVQPPVIDCDGRSVW
ncbi:hypothetical protein MUK42_02371 [Musa troglodytarum]|uniref:Bifunctional inhibitor/plant lipid transfer protein/seed storage helical domain-containing protein n=1 Tax=Musa troglodytarum TaxID=320322 RepID=A0A9E7ERM4_9LILI|nr:hypothetical protein MUK42_02371 [Musa troglodytarum]